MHSFRHGDNDYGEDNNQPRDHRPSDHRADTINRTHSCECYECSDARDNRQPDPDQSILNKQDEWFAQHAQRPASGKGCEFQPATASGTAKAEDREKKAGVSSAGTGAGCSAAMGVSAKAGVSSAGTGAGCSVAMGMSAGAGGSTFDGLANCSRYLCTEATSRSCGYYSSHLNINGEGLCQQPACKEHLLCPFHQTQETERLCRYKRWERSPFFELGTSPPGHSGNLLCARHGCTYQSMTPRPWHRRQRNYRPRIAKTTSQNYCSRACRFVDANGELTHLSECNHPECFLETKRTDKNCQCHNHRSSRCHHEHKTLQDLQIRGEDHACKEQRRHARK